AYVSHMATPDALFSWQRGAGEGTVAKIRNALVRYRPLGEPLGHREPPTRRRAVQLDLPRRRPSPQQHPRLRLPGCQRLAPPPAPTRRRRQGPHVPRQLRKSLGPSHPALSREPPCPAGSTTTTTPTPPKPPPSSPPSTSSSKTTKAKYSSSSAP